MKLVADANILFSALLKDGTTRQLWTHPGITLHAPDFIIREFLKYESHLLEKNGGKPKEFKRLIHDLLTLVSMVEEKDLEAYMPAAATLSNDKKDWPYLACALKENADLWSNDSEFKRQHRVTTYTTTELIQKIGKL